MPEDSYASVGPALLNHSRQQRKMIILHQHHRLTDILHFLEQSVRKLPVHFLIMLPIAGPEKGTRVRDMTEGPEPLISKSVVIALLLFLGEPDSPQRVMRIIRGNQQSVVHV